MYTGNFKKKNGKLIYLNSKERLFFMQFVEKLKEGDEVEMFISVKGTKATGAQIAKVHSCIRIIAMELGYSFDDMKLIIKSQAGLCDAADDGKTYAKSFADCSMEEISMAIEACNEIAEENNIILG